MKVTLLHYTPLWVASYAIRKCWQSQDKSDTVTTHTCVKCGSTNIVSSFPSGYGYCDDCDSEMYISTTECGPNDRLLIDRVGNKNKHSSTLEHLVYSFDIVGVSRALLQELARHRIASMSVKSTRYTLKELRNEKPFLAVDGSEEHIKRASKYIVITGVAEVDLASIRGLEEVRKLVVEGISNDKSKYALIESYKTELVYTINARALQNFLQLRTSPSALWEIRELATAMYNVLPEDHKYLFSEYVYDEEQTVAKLEAEIEKLQLKLQAENKKNNTKKYVQGSLL